MVSSEDDVSSDDYDPDYDSAYDDLESDWDGISDDGEPAEDEAWAAALDAARASAALVEPPLAPLARAHRALGAGAFRAVCEALSGAPAAIRPRPGPPRPQVAVVHGQVRVLGC